MRRVSWATLALVVLGVVAVVLAFAAMRATRPSAPPQPAGSAFGAPSPTPSPSRDGDRGPDDVPDAVPPVVEPPLLLADVDVAYRATIGSCLGGATLERTSDGGRRWTSVTVPAAGVYALAGNGGAPLQLIGVDGDCTLQQWVSADGGRTWSAPTPASGVFSRLPGTTRRIATPTGEQASPCPDRSVAPLAIEPISETSAAVLCDGGGVYLTDNGGATWSAASAVAGAEALAFEGPELGWVLVRSADVCPGYRLFRTIDGGGEWVSGGCVGTAELPDERSRPSLSFLDTEIGMADLGGETFVTSDAGLQWAPAR